MNHSPSNPHLRPTVDPLTRGTDEVTKRVEERPNHFCIREETTEGDLSWSDSKRTSPFPSAPLPGTPVSGRTSGG